MANTVAGIHLSGNHAGRPAGNAVPDGTLYSCTTHSLIYQSNYAGNSWATWATLGATASGSITSSGYTQNTARLLGRTTASSGAIEEITVGTGLTLSAGSLSASGGGGSDVVNVASGAGSVTIPGLKGSPDAVPASPSATDDEFDAFSGWTTLGTLDTSNVTDFPSHWHGTRALAGASIAGIYKAIPGGGMPFTMTAKMNEAIVRADNQFAGLMVLESSPGKATTFAQVHNGSGNITCSMYRWTNATTFASSVNGTSFGAVTDPNTGLLFPYMRIVCASSTDVTLEVSAKGFLWRTVAVSNQNPSLTIANIGLVIGDVAGASTVEAVFDWVRFT